MSCAGRPIRSLVGKDRSAAGVRDWTGPEPPMLTTLLTGRAATPRDKPIENGTTLAHPPCLKAWQNPGEHRPPHRVGNLGPGVKWPLIRWPKPQRRPPCRLHRLVDDRQQLADISSRPAVSSLSAATPYAASRRTAAPGFVSFLSRADVVPCKAGRDFAKGRAWPDTEEVTGSNPVAPTNKTLTSGNARGSVPFTRPQRPREQLKPFGKRSAELNLCDGEQRSGQHLLR